MASDKQCTITHWDEMELVMKKNLPESAEETWFGGMQLQ